MLKLWLFYLPEFYVVIKPSLDSAGTGILKHSGFNYELWVGEIIYLQVYLPQHLEKYFSTCFCAILSLSVRVIWNGTMTCDRNSGQKSLAMQYFLGSWTCSSQCLSPVCFVEGDIPTSYLAGLAEILESLV